VSLQYVNLICDLYDGTGQPVDTGTITFTPNATLTDSVDHVTITQTPIVVNLLGNPLPTVSLAATDNVNLSPSGWSWLLCAYFPGALPRELFLLPFSGGSTQYLSHLIPAVLGGFLPLTGGTVTGAVTLTGTPPLAIPGGAAAGNVLTSDVSGNASWQAVAGGGGAGTVAISQGGTGQVTAPAAFNALSPNTTLGDITYGSGTSSSSRLPGNTAAAKNFLTQTGTGSVSAVPAWGLLAPADVPGVGGISVAVSTPVPGMMLTATSGVSAGWAFSVTGMPSATPPFLGDAIQRLAIPSYFYPTFFNPTGYWQQMQSAAPYASICVINPGSGPGGSSNSDYVTQTKLAQAAGMKVLGYVHTSYTGVTLGAIEAQIDSYYGWYSVDGIFVDEVSTSPVNQPYYLSVYNYVKGKAGSDIVVVNPGTVPDESYMAACDIMCNCEVDLGTYRVRAAAAWEVNYPSSRFWHIIYSVLTAAQRDEVLTLSRNFRAGYVHITNDGDPNPYDTIPADPYWSGLVTQIAAPYPVPSQAPVLEDGFDATTGNINVAWTVAGSPVITSHQLVILGHSTFADTLTSAATWAFAGRAATVQVTAVPAATSGQAWMRILQNSTNFVAIGTIGPNLTFRNCVSGTNSDTSVTYNGTTHLYWRIAQAAGVVTWQTSPDNAAWTVQRTVSSGLPVLTAASFQLAAGHSSGGDPDQSASFDNVLVL